MADIDDVRKLDYAETVATWRHLVDVRFKLLALIPTLSGLGVGILGSRKPSYDAVLVAVLAILTIVSIAIYELRNTIFHDTAIHRAKMLEVDLGFRRSALDLPKCRVGGQLSVKKPDSLDGGWFVDRPRGRIRLFGIIPVWHDFALWVVYSASAGAWGAVGVYTFAAVRDWSPPWTYGSVGGLLVALGLMAGFAAYQMSWDRLIDRGLLPPGGVGPPSREDDVRPGDSPGS